jgi:hypothetical protein
MPGCRGGVNSEGEGVCGEACAVPHDDDGRFFHCRQKATRRWERILSGLRFGPRRWLCDLLALVLLWPC